MFGVARWGHFHFTSIKLAIIFHQKCWWVVPRTLAQQSATEVNRRVTAAEAASHGIALTANFGRAAASHDQLDEELVKSVASFSKFGQASDTAAHRLMNGMQAIENQPLENESQTDPSDSLPMPLADAASCCGSEQTTSASRASPAFKRAKTMAPSEAATDQDASDEKAALEAGQSSMEQQFQATIECLIMKAKSKSNWCPSHAHIRMQRYIHMCIYHLYQTQLYIYIYIMY
jgi:hypothetical protein